MTQRELEPGAQVGPYTIEALLGRGGQATTWRARDTDGSQVALKHFSLAQAADWKAVELFEREAKVLEHLDHPSIPRFHESFTEGPDCYIAQDLVEGRSLAAALEAGGTFDEDQLIALAQQVLEVLDWLHTRAPPVVHRDLKPSNLLMRSDGRAMLIDFGAVQRHLVQEPEGGSTVVGTHGYMAPEQLMGRAEPASDLYGFGATLVHLATGRHPGDLPTRGLELDFERHSPLSERFNTWLGRMTASDPRMRPASAAAALTELQRPPAEPAPPVVQGLPEDRARRPVLTLMAGVFALVAILVVYLVAVPKPKHSPPPPVPKRTADPERKVFVELPVTLSEGCEGADIEVRSSMLRRAESGFPRSNYELRIALSNPGERPITTWKGLAVLRAFGKETRLRWHLVDPVDKPLMPGERRVIRLSEWDTASNLKGVELRLRAPKTATSVPEPEPKTQVNVAGLTDASLGQLSHEPTSEHIGDCRDTRCFDFVFTLGDERRDWLKLKPNCEGPTPLVKGTYNDRIFQIGTKVLRTPYTKPGDRFAFRVFCPADATGVSWRLEPH